MNSDALRNDNEKLITVTVTVFDVGQNGNSPSGRFLFNFDKEVVHVTLANTEVRYQLSEKTLERGIRFVGYFASASDNQLIAIPGSEPSQAHPKSEIRLNHSNNTSALLVNVSLHVSDKDGKVRGAMDPQITNTPSPH